MINGTPGSGTSSSSPAVDASGGYVSCSWEITFAFTHTGVPRWLYKPGCHGGGGRTSVLAGGRLYVRDLLPGYPPAVLDTASGERLEDFVSELPPAISGSTMYNTVNGVLYATDLATHLPRWRLVVPWGVVVPPVVANGRVWTVGGDGTVRAVDLVTGRVLWSASAGTRVTPLDEDNAVVRTGIAVAEGRLVVPARDRLTVFTQPVTMSGPARTTYGATVTLAATAWPGASVRVWVRRGAETSYRLLATVTADSRGRATASLRTDHDYRWYADADGLRSVIGTTLVAPTLTGPALAAKGSTVTVRGTTVPGRSVGLWFRRAGTTTYVLRTTRTANSYGRFSYAYVADATYSYYAATSCCRSPTVTTRVG